MNRIIRSTAQPALRGSASRIYAPTSTSLRRSYASHGAPHFNEPTGYIFGEKPPPAGQRRKKEEWETIWYWGMFGSMVVAAVGLYYKPDTSINKWALQEAKERMEARGDTTDYRPS